MWFAILAHSFASLFRCFSTQFRCFSKLICAIPLLITADLSNSSACPLASELFRFRICAKPCSSNAVPINSFAPQGNSIPFLFSALHFRGRSGPVYAIPVHVGSLSCVAIPSLVNAIQFHRFAFQSISLAMNRVAFPVPIGASLSYSDTFLCFANPLRFASPRGYAIPVRFGPIPCVSFASTFCASPIRCRSQLLQRRLVHRISPSAPCSSVSIRFVASQFPCKSWLCYSKALLLSLCNSVSGWGV